MFTRIIALLLMLLLSPIFLLISLIIIINDGLPIIFVQKRSGKDNRLFNLYKFRTMKKETPNVATHLMDGENNYIISTSENAENAKIKITQFKFDLIVLDVMMPGQNGYDLTREIKKKIYY